MGDTQQLRQTIIHYCLEMNAQGFNQGVSGNISARVSDRQMLITPTGIPYDQLESQDIVSMMFDGSSSGTLQPSSEWRFHAAIYDAYPATQAIVHAHPWFATTLAIQHIEIPAIHYMITIAGGNTIPVADYATFGTDSLAENIVMALQHRTVCLIEHHGLVAIGSSVAEAFYRASETENLARQYVVARLLGEPHTLPPEEIDRVLDKLQHYGLRSKNQGSEMI